VARVVVAGTAEEGHATRQRQPAWIVEGEADLGRTDLDGDREARVEIEAVDLAQSDPRRFEARAPGSPDRRRGGQVRAPRRRYVRLLAPAQETRLIPQTQSGRLCERRRSAPEIDLGEAVHALV
jgi:hypothetical protein